VTFSGKPFGKPTLERPRPREKCNIKTDPRAIVCKGSKYFELAQDCVQRLASVI
jgi:hypothetical protein